MIRKSFKYRVYPNVGARKHIYRAMKFGITPVWNACIAEREQARQKYRERLELLFKSEIEKTGQELTDKDKADLRKKLNAELKKEHFWPTAYDQYKHVRKSEHPEYANFHAGMLQCAKDEVDGAEKSFLALWTKGDKEARPPKQQRMHRKIMFRQSGWKPLIPEIGRVCLTGIGWLKFKMHRPIQGKVKAVIISQKNRKYYISFSCEIDDFPGRVAPCPKPKPFEGNGLRQEHASTGGSDPQKGGAHNTPAIFPAIPEGGSDPEKGDAHNVKRPAVCVCYGGSDPEKRSGINIAFGFKGNVFLYDSAGRIVGHPAFYQNCIEKLAELNRRLDSKQIFYVCKKCGHRHKKVPSKKICDGCMEYLDYFKQKSKNWRKAKYTLEKFHEKLANKRAYFLWHLAKFYASNYKIVRVPNWPLKKQIEYASDNKTAIRLTDGAYAKFIQMLTHKCNELGSKFLLGPENKEMKERAKKLDAEKAKIKRIKKVLKKTNSKLRKEAI